MNKGNIEPNRDKSDVQRKEDLRQAYANTKKKHRRHVRPGAGPIGVYNCIVYEAKSRLGLYPTLK